MKYVVYGMPKCNYCVRAKNLLSSKRVSYSYVDIKENSEARHFVVEEEDHYTVPQVYTRDALGVMSHIGGYMDLVDHFRNMSN